MTETVHDSRPATREHIWKVQAHMYGAREALRARGVRHDLSKLVEPELSGWDQLAGQGERPAFGTPEYHANLKAVRSTIDLHYAANDHHPQHFEDGVLGMSLLSMLEMVCDWKAASERQASEMTFEESLAYSQERLGYSDDIARIIHNTAKELGFV